MANVAQLSRGSLVVFRVHPDACSHIGHVAELPETGALFRQALHLPNCSPCAVCCGPQGVVISRRCVERLATEDEAERYRAAVST